MARSWCLISFLRTIYPVTEWFALGATGVRLFFVLSGFLITGILLRERDSVEQGKLTLGDGLRAFYLRRSLRIFPLYYAVVIGLFIMDYGMMREEVLWHLTYTENFYRVFAGGYFLNHFWSLCVEEHFYLIWPFVIFWTPRAWLGRTMIGFIVAAQGYRVAAWIAGAGFTHLNIVTFANLDTLALGGLLALATAQAVDPGRIRTQLERWGLLIGGLACTALVVLFAAGWITAVQRAVWLSLAEGFLFMGVISVAARSALPGARFLVLPLSYIGKISYGLYVLHPLVWHGLEHLEREGTIVLPQLWFLRLPLFFGLALLAATISWQLFELPFNRMKRWFPYGRKP